MKSNSKICIKSSPFLESMIDGLLISDAGLRLRYQSEVGNTFYKAHSKPTPNANFYLSSSRREFLEKVSEIFFMHGIRGKIRESSPGRKMRDLGYSHAWKYETQCLPFFTNLYQKWYSNRVKIIPKIVTLEPAMLAYWLIGDGSNQLDNRGGRSRRIIFCTECFSIEDQNYLVHKFREIGIYAHTEKTRCNKKGEDQFRIIISRAVDVNIFIDKVEFFVPPEFQYKVARPTVLRIRKQYFTKKKSDAQKKEEKAERERKRYQRKRDEILKKQAEYYVKNKTEIRKNRSEYVNYYNKLHSVRDGDKRYQKENARTYTFKTKEKEDAE